MKLGHWIIDNDGRIKQVDLLTWALWIEKDENRVVKQECVGESMISTIFLGLDYNLAPTGPIILWETMIFGGPMNQYIERCAGNREQAEAMHQKVLERVRTLEVPRGKNALP